MGDPALADAWKAARHRITTECFASSPGTICRQHLEEFKRDRREYWRGKVFSLSSARNLFLLRSLVSLTQAVATETLLGAFTHFYWLCEILLNCKSGFDLCAVGLQRLNIFVLILQHLFSFRKLTLTNLT